MTNPVSASNSFMALLKFGWAIKRFSAALVIERVRSIFSPDASKLSIKNYLNLKIPLVNPDSISI
jgi:hypothetical protein